MGDSGKIGGVTLNLEKYKGKDLYCDGAVEDEILDIVKKYPREKYPEIIAKKKSWPVLYHLSDLRSNIVEWIRVEKGARILEIGSGCGAITGVLADKAGKLDCVELSKKRSMINAYRHKEKNNITIHVGNFEDIEPSLGNDYDYIFLIGVFEYAAAYIHDKNPYHRFLEIINCHRKKNGRIVIAIENRLGLKYFAGAREDHLGSFFTGMEDYPAVGSVHTFSKPALEQIFIKCGLTDYHFFYPYPDYKFMHTLYSDNRLPQEGELTSNLLNMDRSRLLLFDEKEAFDSMIRDGLFPIYSNSYLVMIGGGSEVLYSKYSNDRAPKCRIRTDIIKPFGGAKYVEKHALQKEAKEHLELVLEAGKLLKERYAGSPLIVCACEQTDKTAGVLRFPYLVGETLEHRLDRALYGGDKEKLTELLRIYRKCVEWGLEYEITDEDMIFSNILIHHEKWQLIDYEWSGRKKAEPERIIRRALWNYIAAGDQREKILSDDVLTVLGLNALDKNDFMQKEKEREEAFQRRFLDGHTPLGELYRMMGGAVIDCRPNLLKVDDELERIRQEELRREKDREMREALERLEEVRCQAQLYYDTGNGFSEKDSMILEKQLIEEGSYRAQVKLPAGTKAVRFDPMRTSCIVSLQEMSVEGTPVRKIKTNGYELEAGSWLFLGDDPNISGIIKKKGQSLLIRWRVLRISNEEAGGFLKR